MENMAYCRWENTLAALRECQYSLTDELSDSEQLSRIEVLVMAAHMLGRIGVSIDLSELVPAVAHITNGGRRG